jgi:hypothetical protein
VVDWLLWALFSSSRNELDVEEHAEELNEYIAKIEDALGKKLQDCSAEGNGVRSMRITLDPVPMLHRPLLWYTVGIFSFSQLFRCLIIILSDRCHRRLFHHTQSLVVGLQALHANRIPMGMDIPSKTNSDLFDPTCANWDSGTLLVSST